ncbi:hypothetical protein [Bradyrhizobium sp. RT11b]|uniref:hypothetical protein n=1 Tax=Bradyrhizobium sp. RT11b TaxID=3156332 RepID=UPI003397AEB2
MSKPDNQSSGSVEALLAGAERGRTRVRGFAPWQPRERSLKLLGQVQAVLGEYVGQLPITVRQIYYRLIGAHGYGKDGNASDRLGELINRARRARLITMDAIRDDGGVQSYPPSWRDALHFLENVRRRAETLQLDRSVGQPVRLIIMCEAAGMVPQLARVAHEYGVPVLSSGGFDSVTEKHNFAAEIADDGRPTKVLHIGDHDPSGAHMFIALAEDVEAFARELGGSVSFTRLAVTPQQIAELALETQVKKVSDNRAFGSQTTRTCQAEAIAPDILAQIVRVAIESRIDRKALCRVLACEKRARRELSEKLKAAT